MDHCIQKKEIYLPPPPACCSAAIKVKVWQLFPKLIQSGCGAHTVEYYLKKCDSHLKITDRIAVNQCSHTNKIHGNRFSYAHHMTSSSEYSYLVCVNLRTSSDI